MKMVGEAAATSGTLSSVPTADSSMDVFRKVPRITARSVPLLE